MTSAAAAALALSMGLSGPAAASAQHEGDVRGVVRAEAAATVSSEIVARIDKMPFKAGQGFRAGDVLLTFDCRRYEAELRAAEAEVRTQKIALRTENQLLLHRATGANDLELAEARHARALATAEALEVRTSQCVIKAPYDGRIVERSVDVFEVPQANAPLMKIIKEGRLEVDLIVPSHWAVWLEPGHEFQVKISETATVHKARLLHLGAVIDPVSRTMKITAELVDPAAVVRPGMSVAARIKAPGEETR